MRDILGNAEILPAPLKYKWTEGKPKEGEGEEEAEKAA